MGRYGQDYRMGQGPWPHGPAEGYDSEYGRGHRGFARGRPGYPEDGWQGTGWGGGPWADPYGPAGRFDYRRGYHPADHPGGTFRGGFEQEELPNWGGGFGWMNRRMAGGFPSGGYGGEPRNRFRPGPEPYGRDFSRARYGRYDW